MNQMKKLLLGLALMSTAVWFTSCDPLAGMVKLVKDQKLTVDPNPLELHGTNVPFKMSAVLPVTMMKKDTKYDMEVYIRPGDINTQKDGDANKDEMKITTISADGNQYAGQTQAPTLTKDGSFKYDPKYNVSGLWIKGVVSTPKNGKSKKFPTEDGAGAVRIMNTPDQMYAIGIVTTTLMVKSPISEMYDGKGDSPFAYADPEYTVSDSKKQVRLDYEKGNSTAKKDFGVVVKNKEQIEVIDLFVKEKVPTFTATVVASHSPEGSESTNTNLVKGRAQNLADNFAEKMKLYNYKKEDVDKYNSMIVTKDMKNVNLRSLVMTVDEFKELVDKSSLTADQKNEAKKIMEESKAGKKSFVECEMELSKKPYYNTLENEVYPKMRYSRVEITLAGGKKTPAEMEVIATDVVAGKKPASSLSEAEYLTLVENTPDRAKRAAYLEAGVKEYPTWKMYNNLGAVYLDMMAMSGDKATKDANVAKAKTAIQTSISKKETAENTFNMAMVFFYEGNNSEAEKYLAKAIAFNSTNPRITKLINGAKGYLAIRAADSKASPKYEEAVQALTAAGDTYSALFNRALARHLRGDNSGATADINAAIQKNSKDGDANYLAAIIAMKNNQLGEMKNQLVAAFGKNSNLKTKAAADPVFAKVRNSAEYKDALK